LLHWTRYYLTIMISMSLALSFVSLLAVMLACPEQYSFPSCVLDVYYIDSSCFNFDFIGCEYTGYTSVIVSYDWQECANLCCDSSLPYLMNADSLALCSNFNSWSTTANLIIIALVMVAFVIPSLVVMVKTLVTCYKRCRDRQ
jgi:hypothetical protein